MKKQIRKTGEIIEVITYSGGSTQRTDNDYVSYINERGEERSAKLNYFWDLADVDDNKVSYWEDFRNKAALKIFSKRLSSCYNDEDIIESMSLSIHYANHLTSMLMDNKFKKE